MKKKVVCVALSAILSVSAFAMLSSCGETKTKEDVVRLKTTAPICFIADKYTDASITSTTFTVEYNAKHNLTAELADATLATLTEVSKSEADGVVSVTYKMEGGKSVGKTTVNFTEKGKVVDTVPASVKKAYPDTDYKMLSSNNNACYTHDPVVMEVPEGYTIGEDTYYYFSYSTDNDGSGFGAPVKASKDLIEWKKIGPAIEGYKGIKNGAGVRDLVKSGSAELKDVYQLLSSDSTWKDGAKEGCWTLWAPDVVPAPDGGYWLYGSWTTTFGSRRSVIFQCYSKTPVGPFKYKDIVVYSPNPGNDGKQSNAIDPSIFYDADGEMYMSYGSFSDFRVIPLDKNTGFRKDGLRYTVDQMKKDSNFYKNDVEYSDDYFGEKILDNRSIEGSVIEYFANVPVYKGDVKDYSDSKLTYEDNYYLVGSANGLDKDYSMRVYKGKTPTGTFKDCYNKNGSSSGSVISATYTWSEKSKSVATINYFVPGHNDLLTTSANEHFISYHNRVVGSDRSFATDQHYLTTSLIAFNSQGNMVMSPVRYAGESLRKVTAAEVTKYSDGNYYGILNHSSNFGTINYAEKYSFNEDGTISGAKNGTWTLYGDNYMYIVIDGVEFYGVVMPGYCVKEDAGSKKGYAGKGGLVISAIGEKDGDKMTLFFEMLF